MKKYTYPIKLGLLIAVLVNSYSANAVLAVDETTSQASTDLILDAATTLLGSGSQTTKDSSVNSAFTSIQGLIPPVLDNASSTQKSAAAELVITTIIQKINASNKSADEKNQAIALLVGQASKAFPEYAANFTTAAVTAAPTLAGDIVAAAVAAAPAAQAAAITAAAVAAAPPAQAAAITAAAVGAAPAAQAAAITAAAVGAAPAAQAAAITAAAVATQTAATPTDTNNSTSQSSESTVAQINQTALNIVVAATEQAKTECASSTDANCFSNAFKTKTTELAAQSTSAGTPNDVLAFVNVVIKTDPSVSAH